MFEKPEGYGRNPGGGIRGALAPSPSYVNTTCTLPWHCLVLSLGSFKSRQSSTNCRPNIMQSGISHVPSGSFFVKVSWSKTLISKMSSLGCSG